jgi:prepilin-type N-terminal cleavage/methylation domain-containing protein
MIFMQKNSGFTLMEVLIAAALLGLVAITAVAINLSASHLFRVSTTQTKSQDEAAIVMERILRDIRSGYGANISVSPNSLQIYTVPYNMSTQSWSNFILYQFDTYTNPPTVKFYPYEGTAQIVSTKITSLNFLEVPGPTNPNCVNIKVQLTAQEPGAEAVSLESTATLLYRPVKYPWE